MKKHLKLLVFILPVIGLFILLSKHGTKAAWFDNMWHYRKAITFENDGDAVSNQKVKLDVNTAAAVEPNTANFNAYDVTFTPALAKRNASTGSSAPFATGVLIQGNLANADAADSVTYLSGDQISGSFYENADTTEGSLVMWFTPEWSSATETGHHTLWEGGGLQVLYPGNNTLTIYNEPGSVQVMTVSNLNWVAGNTYNIVIRWDEQNTLDGTNYAAISINNVHTFGGTSAIGNGDPQPPIAVGSRYNGIGRPAGGLIEGLTVYRRPLWDGSYGIDVGNGDEIEQIFNNGAGQDPTLVTGSWDVVFDLPTNSSTGALGAGTTAPGQAWSHPHSSNLLGGTNGKNGFMMDGTYTDDGWEATGTLSPTTGPGDSLYFDGSNDLVHIPANSEVTIAENAGLTVSAWVYLRLKSHVGYGTARSQTIVNLYDINAHVFSLSISGGTAENDGKLYYSQTDDNGVTWEYVIPDAHDPLWDEWHHVAIVTDPNEGEGRLYIDGTEIKNSPLNSFPSFTFNSDYFDIGKIYYWSDRYAWGNIRDVRVYGRTLSEEELRDTMYKTSLTAAESSGLAGRWMLDEGTGQTVVDSSGNGSNGTLGANDNVGSDDPVWSSNVPVPTVEALATAEKIFGGGYKTTSNAADQGIYQDISVSAGDDWVVRALAHSDGTSIPKIILYDQTNDAEIGSMTGTVGSGRTDPDVFIFTGEAPAGCETLRVKLVNTESSGTVYWHQVEVLPNLITNPSMEVGSSATGPWIPTGWSNSWAALDTGEGIQETESVHSGNSAFHKSSSAWDEFISLNPTDTAGTFYMFGGFFKGPSGYAGLPSLYTIFQYYNTNPGGFDQIGVTLIDKYYHKSAVYRCKDATSSYIALYKNSAGAQEGYYDDLYYLALDSITLTVTPASQANSTEGSGLRVDGRDTAVSTISNLSSTQGTIKFQYTPRHSAANSNKFVESGTVTDDVYIGEWYGDADDFIKLYWDTNNSLKLEYNMGGVTNSGTTAPGNLIAAGTTYDMQIDYTGGGNMTLSIDGSDPAITLSSIPAAFGTTPDTAYWGTNASGTGQADATYAQITASTGIKMQTGCEDVRFTDANGKLLDFYYDASTGPCNTETTDFYVLMPTIVAGKNTIYMYYGNPSASSASKAANFSQETFTPASQTTASEEKGTSPTAYWKLDDGQGSTAYDSSSSENNLTLGTGSSAPAWQTEDLCKAGMCLKFDGNDYATAGSTAYNVQSVSFWVRPASTSQTFLDLDGGTHYISASNGTISAEGFASPTIYVNGKANGSVTANEWNHVEVTTATAFDATAIRLGMANGSLLTGFLDDVKVFSYARSAAEIKKEFKGAGTPEGASVATTDAVARDALSEGLVGYWSFDEGSGTTTADKSGNGNTGTLGTGDSAPTWGTGKFGNGLSFDGSDDYVNISNGSYESDTQGTIALWAYVDTAATSKKFLGFGGSDSNKLFGIEIRTQDSANRFSIVHLRPSEDTDWTTSTTAVQTGRWYFLTFTSDGDSYQIFINGEKEENLLEYHAGDNDGDWFGDISPSESMTLINGTKFNNIIYGGVDGTVDEVRIYNRVLSPTEVKALYEWAPGPVAHYTFDEGTGTTAKDTSGHGNDATWVSTPRWKPGKYGKAASFNSTSNNYLKITDTSKLQFDATDSFTIEVWNTASHSTQYQELVANKETGAADKTGYQILLTSYNQFPTGTISDGINQVEVQITTATDDGNWHHTALVVDRNGQMMYIYHNGILKDSDDISSVGSLVNARSFAIGNNGSGIYQLDGKIDDVRIYNYARTQKQIISDMNAGHPNVGSPVGSPIAYYKFDEGYGSTANNSGSQGSTLNGTLASGDSAPSWTLDGKFDKALSFDGDGDYTYTSNTAMMASNGATYPALTISAWINPTSSAASKTIVHKNNEFKLTTDASSQPNCAIYAAGSWQTAAASSTALALDSWTHVVCTYDGSNIKVWQNGKNTDTQAETDELTSSSSTALLLGKDSAATAVFQGKLDEVRVYNYALTESEIAVEFNQGKAMVMGALSTESSAGAGDENAASRTYCIPGDTSPCATPVAKWDFDEGSGTSAYDTSNNSNTLSFASGSNAPAWANGKFSKALDFEGDHKDYLSITDAAQQDLDITGQLTISAWINMEASPPDTYGYIINKGIAEDNTQNSYCLAVTELNWVRFAVSSNGINWTTTEYNSALAINKWHHITAVYNGSNIAVYVNGVRNSTPTDFSSSIFDGSGGVFIGIQEWTWSRVIGPFDGLIDNVTVYDYARTPAQIAWDYNRGKPVVEYRFDECQGTTAYNATLDGNGDAAGINATLSVGATGPQTTIGTCAAEDTTSAWYNGRTGKKSSAISLDGIDDVVTATNTSTIDLNNNLAQEFSIASWVYVDSDGEGDAGQIFWKGDATYLSVSSESGGNVNLNASVDLASTAATKTISSALSTGAWHHIVMTWKDDDDDELTLYVDGVDMGDSEDGAGAPAAESNNLLIGGTTTANFDGLVDEFKVFNYQLTDEQVKLLYRSGAVSFE